MKQFLLIAAATALGICLSAYAAEPTGGDPFALSIPNLSGGLEMSAGGMLARPSGGDTSDSSGSHTGGSSVSNPAPGAGVGVNSGVGYGIPGSGNDVQVQWNSATR